MNRVLLAASVVSILAIAEIGAAQCVPDCRTGYVCNQNQECVSICNPACGAGEVCTAEAQCIADPAAQPYPQQNQGYAQPQPQPQPQAQPQPQPQPQPVAPANPALIAPGSFRLLLTFDPGFGGDATLDVDGFDEVEAELDTTLGARVQAQAPIGERLYLGFEFGVDAYSGENSPSDADRLIALGLNLVFGFHYALSVGSVAIEPTFGAALGFAILTANDVELDDSAFGFGLGIRGGLNVWFTEIVGAQLNLGLQIHQVFDESGGVDFRLGVAQFRLGIGLILRFGATA